MHSNIIGKSRQSICVDSEIKKRKVISSNNADARVVRLTTINEVLKQLPERAADGKVFVLKYVI